MVDFGEGGPFPMHRSPLRDLAWAMSAPAELETDLSADGHARPDLDREERTGAPEIIYASGKSFDEILALARTFVERRGRAILSRLPPPAAQQVLAEFP